MRKKIIAGNYKMNLTINEAEDFVESIKGSINTNEVDVVICPNVTCLDRLFDLLQGTNISLGAQNVYCENAGAYTGETSPSMLYAVGCDYCIVGHSERREIFGETNDLINKKVIKLLEKGIKPILCVGETLNQREDGSLYEVIKTQVTECLNEVSKNDVQTSVIIAYEPIWAIGTGVTATSAQAEEMCKYIREEVAKIYDEITADKVRIQYGGSVNPKNAAEILNMPNIDGALVGGAAIKNDFIGVVNFE